MALQGLKPLKGTSPNVMPEGMTHKAHPITIKGHLIKMLCGSRL
jgi:hypothetical protein